MPPSCKQEGCTKHANFGIKSQKAQFCRTHKTPEMINVISKRCEFVDCVSIPTFNIAGKKAKFCKLHKSPEMIDVVNKRCQYDGCVSLNPIFNIKGEKIGLFCCKHKTTSMIDVIGKKCEHTECELTPSYNVEGGKGRFCRVHKTVDMIDVENKRCEYPGCTSTSPLYGIKNGKAQFCKKHKTLEMVNVKNKYCKYSGCEVAQPIFDIKGGKGTFCAKHKITGMINIKDKICETDGCEILATFNIKGEKRGLFCIKHKTPDMIHVKGKLCESDCTTRANYGRPGFQVTHCYKHKLKGMILKPNAKCSKCVNPAVWGMDKLLRHCELHKTDDDINLLERNCSSCGLLYILDKDNLCESCNPVTNVSARYAKQNKLMNYLDLRGLKGSSTDIMIERGECGKERPDRIYDIGDKVIILECDEHQHRDRQCLCEQVRMANIGQSFGGLPVYFIRWNPDKYISTNPTIVSLSQRHHLVGDVIESIIQDKAKLPSALVSALYMYYDNWKSLSDQEWDIITPLDKT
jgi:hypothetical protein